MSYHDDAFLLRKEKIGWLAIIGWVLAFSLIRHVHINMFLFTHWALWAIVGWFATTFWIAMDASYRGRPSTRWVILWIITGPLGMLIYFLKRPQLPPSCYRCHNRLVSVYDSCQKCGYQSYIGRLQKFLRIGYSDFLHSFSESPSESSRKTIAYLAIAFGVLSIMDFAVNQGGIREIAFLTIPVYWVLVAYWVYLDAKWRRMEPLPWTALVLLSNLVGLVTYLVIRHRDPVVCSQCRAMLNVGLKHCPYCGTATESVCPRCQATVQHGWIFCPACAAQLPVESQCESSEDASVSHPATVSIRGCVTNAENGMPLTGVDVKIDSKTINVSATTDPVGRYLMVDLEPKPYVLIASVDGYVPQTRPFEPNATRSDPVNFSLHKKPL
ncbi:MAG: carboxypeptidase regulatory-like domain-containing protein [Armatimonadota bacterium]